MAHLPAVIIGGGQAGLAMSRCLSERRVDHIVLERGRLAERWRSERWDSLRLLTPSWMSRLPGHRYRGDAPDGFMTAREVVGLLESYAASFAAPLHTGTTVLALGRETGRFVVATDRGVWTADAVVIATGACDTPRVPGFAAALPGHVDQLVPSRYRNPDRLPMGGVLVVGASATGLQLAEEIHRSGRPVTLAVGRHTRMPRRYRGRDILWWLDRMGALDEPVDGLADLAARRAQPSLQLVGRPDHLTLDLDALERLGVRLVGRVTAVEGAVVRLADDLPETTADADRRLARLLDRIDAFAGTAELATGADPAERPTPFAPPTAPTALDLDAAGIRSVLWATGFVRRYPWLELPVLDADGEIRHRGGVTPQPGLYALGLPLLRTRKSTFIDGVGADAAALADHLTGHLAGLAAARAA